MANIFENISLTDCQRPVYTSYELSKKVKQKRKEEGLDLEDFAEKYGVDSVMLGQIEAADRGFTPRLYKVCAKVLELSINQILAVVTDDLSTVSYRASEATEDLDDTVILANKIFNEIIMQRKISAN